MHESRIDNYTVGVIHVQGATPLFRLKDLCAQREIASDERHAHVVQFRTPVSDAELRLLHDLSGQAFNDALTGVDNAPGRRPIKSPVTPLVANKKQSGVASIASIVSIVGIEQDSAGHSEFAHEKVSRSSVGSVRWGQ